MLTKKLIAPKNQESMLLVHKNIVSEGRFEKYNTSYDIYGHVVLEISPDDKDLYLLWDVDEEKIPGIYFESIANGIEKVFSEGQGQGFNLKNARIRVIDGSFSDANSRALAFELAAFVAFTKIVEALKSAA